VALTRWLPDQPNCLPNLPSLLQQPLVQQLLQQPLGEKGTQQPQKAAEQQQQPGSSQQQHGLGSHKPVRLALVFGREEFGLSDEELQACDLACSIPLGRLQVRVAVSGALSTQPHANQLWSCHTSGTARPWQCSASTSSPTNGVCPSVVCAALIVQESLSLSHAVTIVLAQLYQARLSATAGDPLAAQYSVSQPTQLAEGYDSSGTEH
jgi:hypothetical protein